MDTKRFQRQILMPEIGLNGQKTLSQSRVLIVGMGGLGCPTAQTLAAMGVGTLILSDSDTVDISNLHRQFLYGPADQGFKKTTVAAMRLQQQNPELQVEAMSAIRPDSKLPDCDLIIDGTDNLKARETLHELTLAVGKKPIVSAALYRFSAQITVYQYKEGPCLRCLNPDFQTEERIGNCAEAGIAGVLPAIAGNLQALEALKILLDLPGVLSKEMLIFEGLQNLYRKLRLRVREDCECRTQLPRGEEGPKSWEPNMEIPEIGPEEVLSLFPDGLQILDVRESDEISPGSVMQGSQQMGLSQMLEGQRPELQDGIPVLVVCRVGLRSKTAAELLVQDGWNSCYNLKGGLLRHHQRLREIWHASHSASSK